MLEANVESVCVCVTKPRHTHTDPQHAAVKWKIKGPVISLQNWQPSSPPYEKKRGEAEREWQMMKTPSEEGERGGEKEREADDEDAN